MTITDPTDKQAVGALQIQLGRIRRHRGLVLSICAIAVIGALLSSLSEGTTYTGSAALMISSKSRTPEQDAFLAQGYAEYFNQEVYQELLREKAGIPADVDFNARTAAASPILYIEASASNRDAAALAAKNMAVTFRDDVSERLRFNSEQAVGTLRNQVTAGVERLNSLPDPSAERQLVLEESLWLMRQIAEIRSDTSSQLQYLQLDAAVTSTSPNLVADVVLALLGGMVLGVIAALIAAVFDNRLAAPYEVRERLGLDTLAVLGSRPASGTARYEEGLKGLANAVNIGPGVRPAVIALTRPRAVASSSHVAEGLAYCCAPQRRPTLLVQADLRQQHRGGVGDGRSGVAEFLSGAAGFNVMAVSGSGGRMLVLPSGSSSDDPYVLFAPDRFRSLVEQATKAARLVVIDAPPILEAAESQMICASAHRTILVIEEGVTRAADAVRACQLLEQVGVTLLGVVISRPRAYHAAWIPLKLDAFSPQPSAGDFFAGQALPQSVAEAEIRG